MKKYVLAIGFSLFLSTAVFAKAAIDTAKQDNYTQVITKRSEKIVSSLNLTDSAKFKRVTTIIAGQYLILGTIHDGRNAKAKDIKAQAGDDKAKASAQITSLDSVTDIQLNQAHSAYITKLSTELTPAQIDQVKDGMTYNILGVTYTAYLDELPNLTDAQKAQIKAWLVEAREHAIDAESSEKKHAWFGKYKGRINNYLSKEGYDMKKAEADWQQRIKDRQAKKANG